MPDPDERAEQALREALAGRAADFEVRHLDVPAPRFRRWRVPALAAASVCVIAASLYAVPRFVGDGGATSDPGGPATTSPTISADAGMRVVVYRNLAIEVPTQWVDSRMPEHDGCGYPPGPFVATLNVTQASRLSFCMEKPEVPRGPDGFPIALVHHWSPNLQLTDARYEQDPLEDEVLTWRGWQLHRRTIGGVALSLLIPATEDDLAQRILDSARTVEQDHNGCAVESPVQAKGFVRPNPASDVAEVDAVDTISVCMYDRIGTGQPGLAASRLIAGDAADALLYSIQAAPLGGGPDTPHTCSNDGDTAIAVRLNTTGRAPTELYVYYDTCRGNGFDDGATKRQLTPESCRPLWGGRVQHYSGSSAPFRVCHAPQ